MRFKKFLDEVSAPDHPISLQILQMKNIVKFEMHVPVRKLLCISHANPVGVFVLG